MSNQYLGEIRMVGFNFAPVGWALCNGQLLAISSNTALFALLGTFYGGNGTTTFALPNLMGRVPIHQGTGAGLSTYVIGEQGGVESVTLITSELPAHSHIVNAVASGGNQASPEGGSLAIESTGTSLNYSNAAPTTAQMNAAMIANAGSNLPHTNIQPFLCVNFIIALTGIFPARN